MTNHQESAHVIARQHPRSWRRFTLRGLVAVALGLAVALPGAASAASPADSHPTGARTAVPGTAAGQPAAEVPEAASHAPAPAPGLQPVALPGRSGSSYTVTLPTGDQVVLSRQASGTYLASAAPRSTSRMTFSVLGRTVDQAQVSALPDSATDFIQLHLIDARAFDVTWLAAHGDTGADAVIPLTVHYGGSGTAAALTARAGALAGATVVRADAGDGDVDLQVVAARAGAFWAALTGGTGRSATAHGTARPAFSGGITAAWPTGDRTPASLAPADAPSSTVTWTFTAAQGDAVYCPVFSWFQGIATATACPYYPVLIGLTGTAAGQTATPTGVTCLDTSPCNRYAVTFSVPNGVYDAQDMSVSVYRHGMEQLVDTVVPQVVVAGDSTVDTDLDTAAKLTVDTPQPAVDLEHYLTNSRATPGVYSGWEQPDSSGLDEAWAVPTAPVTIGDFHLSTFWLRGQAPVSGSIGGGSGTALQLYYPRYTDLDSPTFKRFSGTTTAQVVNVGYGTAADFAGVDVRGKLVLMRRASGIYQIQSDQLSAALQAGAAGVLVDPRDVDPTNLPVVPVEPDWWWTGGKPVQIPFATVTPDEAAALTALLARGPATVSVTDHGYSPYFYNLAFDREGRIPTALRYSVDGSRLARQSTTFHSSQPGSATQVESVLHPDDFFALLIPSVFAPAPSTVQEYYGPVSPDLVWDRITTLTTAAGVSGPDQALNVFDRPGSRTEDWFAAPESLGVPAVPDADYRTGVTLGQLYFCAFCRQGDTFYPTTFLTSGADPALVNNPYATYSFAPSAVHLYRDGVELPQQTEGTMPVYQLSDGPASYRLTVGAADLDSDWTFSSRRPTADALPEAFRCMGDYFGQSGPCDADPLIQLRYNAFVDAGNAVTADATHRIQITPYLGANPSLACAVTSFTVWTSTDGGGTWTQSAVSRSSSGVYTAEYRVPSLARTSGSVSVRVQAADAAGDSVTQTSYDAYPLTAG